ncbi:MAG TPA: hypothetical protein DDX85_05600 [Nitrospiraceae bacterium]|nr:hypothetical protein [Nitrospiraceae bacterium]
MNKIEKFRLTIILLLLGASFIFTIPAPSYAMDRGGCLTCHRYPGLVKYEKPDKLKVLHISEDKYLLSSHAKVECRECHPKTVQIPHTNVTDVECTVTCHASDKEKVDTIDRSYLTNFHKEQRFAITRLDDESSCRVCHPLYPHSQHNKVRALLNMHTGFMLCEVCHIKDRNQLSVSYDWKKPEEFEFTGEPYGTHEKNVDNAEEKPDSVISKMLKILDDPKEPAEAAKVRHFISRIAVYRTENGINKLIINTEDNQKAGEFIKNEKRLSPADREKDLIFFHRHIAKKEISVACDECHSPKGIIDFRKLGFSESKAKDLQYLNIKGLVTKYDTFYIPNLFGPKK